MNLRLTLLAGLVLLASVSLVHAADEARTLSYTREADVLHLSWPLAGSAFRLQSKGEVGSPDWTDVPATYATNRFHAFEPMTQPAQFYRLFQDCDPAMRVFVPIAFFRYNTNSPTPAVVPTVAKLNIVTANVAIRPADVFW